MLITLRLLHIVFGALWVGAAVFTVVFLFPLMRTLGPAAGPAMQHLAEKQKFPIYMFTLGLVTILSGAFLAWRDSGVLGFRWFEQGTGLAFGLGAISAISGLLIGITVNLPTGKRLEGLGARLQAAKRPPSAEEQAEMQRLQGKLVGASRAIAVLLVLATIAMAVARYVPA